jgi:hypothetical protein
MKVDKRKGYSEFDSRGARRGDGETNFRRSRPDFARSPGPRRPPLADEDGYDKAQPRNGWKHSSQPNSIISDTLLNEKSRKTYTPRYISFVCDFN